jgi:hypothetical protein
MNPKIDWPEGKQFTFARFDDPDGDTVPSRKWAYPFLADGQISLNDPDRRSMATSGLVRASFATMCGSRSTP